MTAILFALFVGLISAEKLDNTYLPPQNARTAGGSASFLATPFQGGSFSGGNFVSGFPGAPLQRYNSFASAPATVYGAPSGSSVNFNRGSFIPSQGFHGNTPSPAYGAPDAGGAYYKNGAAQPYYSKAVQILRYNNENNGDGSYRFDYETENKIAQHERGQLKNAGTNQESSVVEGSYSYPSPDGKTITVNYVADENGFQASGDHLPVAPVVPEAIQKSLQLNAASGYPSSSGQYYDQGSGQYDAGQRSGQYQSGQLNRQYLTPSGHFDQQSGYRY